MKQKILILLPFLFLQFCSGEDGKEKNEPIPPQPEYTDEQPGVWKGLEKDHLPIVKIMRDRKLENNIHVVIETQFSDTHYIELVGLIDEDKNTIQEIKIGPNGIVDNYLSLDLTKESSKKAKVFVKCVQHDLWTIPISKILD